MSLLYRLFLDHTTSCDYCRDAMQGGAIDYKPEQECEAFKEELKQLEHPLHCQCKECSEPDEDKFRGDR